MTKKIEVIVEELGDYVGVDVDSCNFFRLLKTYFNAANFGMVTVEYNPESGHYHVKIWGNFTPEEGLTIRRILGDDPMRLKMDEMALNIKPGIMKMIFGKLFDYKKIKGKLVKYIKIKPLAEQYNRGLERE